MAKQKTKYVCQNCAYESVKWLGKCPDCQQFSTFEEELVQEAPKNPTNRFQGITKTTSKVEDLGDVQAKNYLRDSSGMQELDRVLGGGLVEGSVVLIGGDPGIGKSTILLQTLSFLNKSSKKVLYVSGEESTDQIALRGQRLNLPIKGIRIFSEIELEKIISTIALEKPKVVVIDSIQTVFSSQLTSSPGSISQIKECAAQLNRMAKETGTTLIMVCHVTKDGDIAGPKALEHIVDTVLFFEGDKANQYRMIRGIKNRFGALNEIGIFSMTEYGLEEVSDPTGIFIGDNPGEPGSAIYVAQEGNRSLIVEIQSLLDTTPLPNPIRRSLGFDLNRLQMVCAVIHKFVELPIYNQQVFVSLIGGMKIADTGIDLPVFLSMISSYKNTKMSNETASFGEIGLTGDLRQVTNTIDRIKEAERLGIKKIIIPKVRNQKDKNWKSNFPKIKIVECSNLKDALDAANLL